MQVLPPHPPSRVLLLVNPNARRGSEGVETAVRTLESGGIRVRLEFFTGPDEVETDIESAAGDADCVAVAGGDGTLSRAGGVLARKNLPLAILPCGTANDLARTLSVPEDLAAAARVILAGHRRRIDLGTVNGHPFFNVASIGLSAELSRELTSDIKKRWGRLSYAIAGARVLTRARPFHARITSGDETVVVRTLQIGIGNGVHYGGGNVVEADAAIDDAHFDLYSLELRNVWKLALMMRTFRSGTHGAWREVRTFRSDEFDITTRRPMPVNVDGDLVTETPAHFRILPAAVTVYAPPAFGAP